MEGSDGSPQVVHLDGSEHDPRIGKARKWLVAISIITLVSGFVVYGINKNDVDSEIRKAEVQYQSMGFSAEQRDEAVKANSGMTWDEAVSHYRGQVNLVLGIYVGLAVAFFAMFLWAKREPLKACVCALLLYLGAIAVAATQDPKTLAQGIPIKILFIGALAKAISAAQEERRLQAHMPRAKLT